LIVVSHDLTKLYKTAIDEVLPNQELVEMRAKSYVDKANGIDRQLCSVLPLQAAHLFPEL
jgi:hypothetical protein